jgi:hypothetical protein
MEVVNTKKQANKKFRKMAWQMVKPIV